MGIKSVRGLIVENLSRYLLYTALVIFIEKNK